MTTAKPKTQALGGMVLAVIAVALVTAILTSAVSSSSADGRTEALASKLERVTDDLTSLRDDQAANQESSTKARARLMRDNEVLKYQNRVLQQKLLIVIRALRANGIEVPSSALTPGPQPRPSTQRPKGPRPPTSRATPTPTAPSPSGPRPSPTPSPCALTPVYCLPPLPTNLPTLF